MFRNRLRKSLALAAVSIGLVSSTLLAADPAPAPAAPPLPVHTIEGYGGGAITPTAYLVNPGAKGEVFGLPSVSGTYINIGHGKNLEAFGLTETLWGRLELSYGLSRFDIGDVKGDIERATTVDIGRDDVYLHTFSARGLILEENSFNTSFLPAITLGAHYKINSGIGEIDDKLGGALSGIGIDETGYEFTLTASKTFGNVFGRPLIVSAGLRNSNAAWVGYLGFGDDRKTTFEANAIYIPTDWLAIGYEFRGKSSPIGQIPGLIDDEDNIHAFSLIFLPNDHLSIALVYAALGNVLNADENQALALQLKWEF